MDDIMLLPFPVAPAEGAVPQLSGRLQQANVDQIAFAQTKDHEERRPWSIKWQTTRKPYSRMSSR